jgi:hypothetical protein
MFYESDVGRERALRDLLPGHFNDIVARRPERDQAGTQRA